MRLSKIVLLVFLVALCFSSCAKQKTVSSHEVSKVVSEERSPSSFEDEVELNNTFDYIMKSKNPELEMMAYLGRQKSIFLRAEAFLSDFDTELNTKSKSSQSLKMTDSEIYKKLIVMWSLRERLHDKLLFFYSKLVGMVISKAPEHKLAKKILTQFNKEVNNEGALAKLAFDDLRIELAELMKNKKQDFKKSFDGPELVESSFKNQQEQIKILRQNRSTFQSLGKKEQALNDGLNQDLELGVSKVKFIEADTRSPQSLAYYPSTGTNGNIMGLVFPKNVWALTYDDGPHPVHTPAIIKNLDTLGIKATFFWLAGNVIRYQSIIDLVKENDMALANHSWSHPQLPKLDDAGLQKEIVKSTQVEAVAYGQKVEYFRCPYGAGNSVLKIRQMIANLGMIHVFWNVDSLDWQDKDPDSVFARAQKQMNLEGHGVILFHDIHPQSVIASRKLVEWSKTLEGTKSEIRWVTIPEIVAEMNKNSEAKEVKESKEAKVIKK